MALARGRYSATRRSTRSIGSAYGPTAPPCLRIPLCHVTLNRSQAERQLLEERRRVRDQREARMPRPDLAQAAVERQRLLERFVADGIPAFDRHARDGRALEEDDRVV